jgi:hypothetical protein
MDLKQEVKELLKSRTQSLKSISSKHKISIPTLTKIRNGDKVSDKSLIYVKSVLNN